MFIGYCLIFATIICITRPKRRKAAWLPNIYTLTSGKKSSDQTWDKQQKKDGNDVCEVGHFRMLMSWSCFDAGSFLLQLEGRYTRGDGAARLEYAV